MKWCEFDLIGLAIREREKWKWTLKKAATASYRIKVYFLW